LSADVGGPDGLHLGPAIWECRIATADLIIAATAEELNLQLATLNTKHFPMFRRLSPPYM
jgi:predicted nucleic acid-binding protein